MIRVCEFKMDGLDQTFKLASMNKREAKEFVAKSKAILDDKEATPEKWDDFSMAVIRKSIATADLASRTAGEEWDAEGAQKVADLIMDSLDIPTANALYLKVLEFSGLRRGEVTAAV